jgi:hypothetical protein
MSNYASRNHEKPLKKEIYWLDELQRLHHDTQCNSLPQTKSVPIFSEHGPRHKVLSDPRFVILQLDMTHDRPETARRADWLRSASLSLQKHCPVFEGTDPDEIRGVSSSGHFLSSTCVKIQAIWSLSNRNWSSACFSIVFKVQWTEIVNSLRPLE